MSVYWYDNSIVKCFRDITGDPRIAINSTDNLFRYIANLKKDDIKLPLISLSRLGYVLNVTTRSPLSSQGLMIGKTKDNKIKEIQAIPIRINYQLDVITRKRDDNDAITDELIFYLVNNPTMVVEIKKGVNETHNFNLFFNDEVVDNSDIESHISQGEYFRSTLTLYVPDAYLWKSTEKKAKGLNPISLIGTTDLSDSSKDYINEEINIKEISNNA